MLALIIRKLGIWYNKYMPIVWMSLGVISFGFFANFIVESTKSGGNTQLYIPAWGMLGLGLVFAVLAYFAQRKLDKKDNEERQARMSREIAREERDKKRFKEEKKMWQDVQLIIPKRENSKDIINTD